MEGYFFMVWGPCFWVYGILLVVFLIVCWKGAEKVLPSVCIGNATSVHIIGWIEMLVANTQRVGDVMCPPSVPQQNLK